MLPSPYDNPSGFLESRRLGDVACAVSFDLSHPVVDVGHWRLRVPIAAVPEAAIQEDGDSSSREGDVHPDADSSGLDQVVDAESQAQPM
jgi:hypothetical protein